MSHDDLRRGEIRMLVRSTLSMERWWGLACRFIYRRNCTISRAEKRFTPRHTVVSADIIARQMGISFISYDSFSTHFILRCRGISRQPVQVIQTSTILESRRLSYRRNMFSISIPSTVASPSIMP
jgi:hypothetical protein